MDNYVEVYSDGESLGLWSSDVAESSLSWIGAHVGYNARFLFGTSEDDSYERKLVLNESAIKALAARRKDAH